MKLVCAQADLTLALFLVNRAVSPNNTLPVLNNILMSAEGKKLILRATNLEIAINASVEAEVENEGTLTIPAKILSSYVSLLEGKEVELFVSGGNTLNIRSTGSETKIKGISSEEFPNLPKLNLADSYKLPVAEIKEALEQVVFACSGNISRPVLTGIYWHFEGKTLKLAATDSYRLGEKTVNLGMADYAEQNFIVPSKTAQELAKVLEAAQEKEFELQLGKGQILFKVDGVELLSRLIEGNFPDYEKILPKESKTVACLSTESFILGLKKVAVIVRENNNNVRIRLENGKVMIFTEETQVGQGASEILAENMTGESAETALNAQYVLDALTHLKSEKVKFGLNDGLSPVKVTPAEEGGYLHIIMPLKL